MKKPIVAGLILAFYLSIFQSNAQEIIPAKQSTAEKKGLFVGGQTSTNGWGGEIKYLFNERVTIKSGYENLNLTYGFDFDQDDINFDATLDYKSGGIYLLGDFNYTKNLYVSGGVLLNSFNPVLTGNATSDLQFGDILIPASKIGDFTFAISPGYKISPYGGLGLRSFIGKNKRVVLNFEGGIYYMGPPKIDIEATGLLAPSADPAHGQKEILENQFEQYKIYPVAKITLAVKLF